MSRSGFIRFSKYLDVVNIWLTRQVNYIVLARLVILVKKIQMHEIVCQYMLTLILQQFSPRFSIWVTNYIFDNEDKGQVTMKYSHDIAFHIET